MGNCPTCGRPLPTTYESLMQRCAICLLRLGGSRNLPVNTHGHVALERLLRLRARHDMVAEQPVVAALLAKAAKP